MGTELDSRLYFQVFTDMVNLNHIHVSGGTGILVHSIVEDVMTASLVTLELERCYAEVQEWL